MFGDLLLRNIEGRDTAARYGGEEFAIIFSCTALPDARHIVDQIRGQFATKQWMLGNKGQRVGRITASFGVAQLRHDEDAEDLLRRADAKLYEAKLCLAGSVGFWTVMGLLAAWRIEQGPPTTAYAPKERVVLDFNIVKPKLEVWPRAGLQQGAKRQNSCSK